MKNLLGKRIQRKKRIVLKKKPTEKQLAIIHSRLLKKADRTKKQLDYLINELTIEKNSKTVLAKKTRLELIAIKKAFELGVKRTETLWREYTKTEGLPYYDAEHGEYKRELIYGILNCRQFVTLMGGILNKCHNIKTRIPVWGQK